MSADLGLTIEGRSEADRAAALTVLALACAAYLGWHLTRDVRFVGPGWDENWQIPLAWLRDDPSLYSKDDLLRAWGRWYPPFWTWLLGRLLSWTGGDVPRLLNAGSSALLLIFGFGNFALARRLSGSSWAALAMALICLRPRQAPFNPWGIMIGNFAANNVGVALAPWLLLGLVSVPRRASDCAWLGLALGLAALLNPSVAFHLCLVSAVALALEDRDSWKLAASLSAAFTPFFLLSSSLLFRGPADRPDVELIRLRSGYLLGGWDYVRAVPDSLLLPAALSAVVPSSFWLSSRSDRRRLAAAAAAAAALWATCWLGRIWPTWILALSWRALFIVYAACLCAGACGLADAAKLGRWRLVAASLALLALCLLKTDLGAFAGRLSGPAPEARLDACRAEFLELSSWASQRTAKDALFLAPPDRFAAFRLYAKRGVVVTAKEGTGFYEGSLARKWKSRLDEISSAYASLDWPALRDRGRGYGADWAVLDAGEKWSGAPEPAFENRCFRAVPL